MKNILVITGSPRKNGNSDMLAEAFIRGARAAGLHTMRFDAGRKSIGGCKACKGCWSKGAPCIVRDDFDELASLLEEADAIILASPLYWFGFTAQIKAAIDRLYPYQTENCPRPLKIRECALLACAADDKGPIFEGIAATYREIAGYMEWTDKGMILVPAVDEKGAIQAGDALKKAEELGASFANRPKGMFY